MADDLRACASLSAPSLDADGAWRIAWLTDGVISQQRQRRRIVTASVEATKGRDMTET